VIEHTQSQSRSERSLFDTEPRFSRRELLKYAGVGAGGLALSSAFPALAAGTNPDVSLSPGTGPPTTSLTVRGRRFVANEEVEVVFDQTVVAKTQVTSKGTFVTEFKVDASTQPGDHLVLARGLASKLQAIQAFTVQTDWAQFGFDAAHTGSNPYENTITPEIAGTLTVVWSDAFGKIRSQPVIVGAKVVVGSDAGTVKALDTGSGEVAWSVELGSPISSSASVAQALVLVGTEVGTLFALDAKSGEQVWSDFMGGAVASPTVADKVAYVASAFSPDTPCNLRALEVASGKLLWEASFVTAVVTSPAVADGLVFVGDDDGVLTALAAASGQPLWKALHSGPIVGSPAVSGGRVFVGSAKGVSPTILRAFEARSGAPIWEADAGVSMLGSPAIADGSIVVFGGEDGSLQAFDASSGQKLWGPTPPGTTSGIAASPCVANGIVFFPSPGQLVGVGAATGDVVATIELEGFGVSSPAVADGRLYIGADDGVHAFGLKEER